MWLDLASLAAALRNKAVFRRVSGGKAANLERNAKMLLFLTLHIIALLFWCASLLYLPALIALTSGNQTAFAKYGQRLPMPRFVFTHVSSPAALVAIMAGTVVFLLTHAVTFWLVVKLTLVTALVVTHALIGLLVMRGETRPEKPVGSWCLLAACVLAVMMAAIIWTVLAKPEPGMWP